MPDNISSLEKVSKDEMLPIAKEDAMKILEALYQVYSKEMESDASFKEEVYNAAADSVISDAEMKYIKEIANKKGDLTSEEVAFVTKYAKDNGVEGFDDPFDDESDVTDEQLEGYAEHLRNYLYTYKDEATDIDPDIDPTEEHKGPMAQDIEKVAPDCVKETPEGVKTVDGTRLALVNAGVIGELARRVLELEERINGR